MEKKDHVIVVLVVITLLLAGMVVFSPGGSSNGASPSSPSAPASSPSVKYTSLSSVPAPVVYPEVKDYFPTDLKLNGLLGVSAYPTSVRDDLGANADYFLSSAVASDAILFIEPNAATNSFVQYEVYKFRNAAFASELLDTYRSNWNVQKVTYSGLDMWVWDGYLGQDSSPYPASVPVYWDEYAQKAFLPISRQGEVIISQLGSDLYCTHGEMTVGEYFIMVDVHDTKNSIGATSRAVWEEVLADLADIEADSTTIDANLSPMSVK